MKSDRLSIAVEFERIDLGDKRLNARALKTAELIAKSPCSSLPQLAPDDSELTAVYRFVTNERVKYDDILLAHVQATAARCAELPTILALHDTTEFKFKGVREGLNPVLDQASTFFGHFSLAVAPGENREALGVLAVELFLSDRGAKGVLNRGNPKPKKSRKERLAVPREQKESFRWDNGVDAAEAAAGATGIIHVADAEADDFALLAKLVGEKLRFVIRGKANRPVAGEDKTWRVHEVLSQAEHVFSRQVSLSPRRTTNGVNVARIERIAKLGVRAARVEIQAPQQAQAEEHQLSLNVVQVFEIDSSAPDSRVEWVLYTTEPIETPEQIESIVDNYRSRWVIEEFFKSVKTGCSFEKRQFTTTHALFNVLALTVPVAWQLLLIRSLGRGPSADEPATKILSEPQIIALRAISRRKVPHKLTIGEAMLCIASVGGHLARNGLPGWQSLGLGFQRLWDALDAHYAISKIVAKSAVRQRCDQS
jgi:hypothetical protein